jgi:hypothetical protein
MPWSQLFPPVSSGPTPDPLMVAFAAGAVTMACFLAGVFFLRFWSRTRDRLFLAFTGAFWLLAANAALPVLLKRPAEEHGEIYLLRLAAFLTIIIAILAKNLRRGGPRQAPVPGRD